MPLPRATEWSRGFCVGTPKQHVLFLTLSSRYLLRAKCLKSHKGFPRLINFDSEIHSMNQIAVAALQEIVFHAGFDPLTRFDLL